MAHAAPETKILSGPVVNIGAPDRETVAEGDQIVFPVTLVGGSDPVDVQFEIIDGSTTADDYEPVTGSVVLDPVTTPTSQIEVRTTADVTSEAAAETFSIRVVDTEEVTPGDAGAGRILDPVLSVTPSATIPEGDDDHEQTFDVSLNVGFRDGLDLGYAATADSAIDDLHFEAASGPLSFAADSTSAEFDVTIHGDQRHGGANRAFSLDLSGFSKPNVVWPGPQTITIEDDESLPAVTSVTGEPSTTEGDSGPTTVTYTVELTEASTEQITLDVTGTDGSAEQAGDGPGSYDYAVPGEVVFEPGETSKTFSVTVNGDEVLEERETATITVTPRDGDPAIGPAAKSAALVIENDDHPMVLTFGGFDQSEGSSDVPVTLDVAGAFEGPLHWTASVRGVSTDAFDSAESDDYDAGDLDLEGDLTSGDSQISLGTMDVLLGSADEFDEAIEFTVDVDGVGSVSGIGIIRDSPDHTEPRLEMVDQAVFKEDREAGLPVRVEFDPSAGNLATTSEKPIKVGYSTADGSALAADDYTAVTGATVTLSDEPPFTELPLTLKRDEEPEDDESFTVSLADPENATLGSVSSTAVTITEKSPTIAVADAPAVAEGNVLKFPVTLSEPVAEPLKVRVVTQGGTAESGSDYPAVDTEIEIPALAQTAVVEVPTIPDGEAESDPETVSVKIIAPEGVTLGTDTATGDIIDAALTVSADDDTWEGNSWDHPYTFTVKSNVAFDTDVKVGYEIVGRTATADEDFSAVSPGELLFSAGDTEKRITVMVAGDEVPEGDETFTIRLTGVTGTTAAVAGVTGYEFTIINDEQMPAIMSVTGPDSLVEGDGPTELTYTVELDQPTPVPVVLAVEGSPYGSAVPTDDGVGGKDYSFPETMTIDAGQSSGTVTVTINGDTVFEEDEFTSVVVKPRDGDTSVRGTDLANLTITNDDPLPALAFVGFDETEGAQNVPIGFTVTGSSQARYHWTATVESSDEGTGEYGVERDFTREELTLEGDLEPGATRVSLGVIDLVTGSADEYDDTVTVQAQVETLGPVSGTGTIRDLPSHKPPLLVPDGDVTVGEGEVAYVGVHADWSGIDGNTATKTEKRLQATFRTVAGTASEGSDYQSESGQLFFEDGDQGGYAAITTNADGVPEPDETLTIEVTDTGENRYTGPSPTVTIKDVERKVGVGDAGTVAEGGVLKFPVSLTAASGAPITVKVSTSAGTAVAGADYTSVTDREVVFAPGEKTKDVEVATLTDDDPEDVPETVFLRVTDTGGVGAGTMTAGGEIADPILSVIPEGMIKEGDDGVVDARIGVRLNVAAQAEVRLDYEVVGDTAVDGEDFDAVSRRSLVFEPGQMYQEITVPVHGDLDDEGAGETFKVRFFAVTGARFAGPDEQTFTIVDDDGAPAIAYLGMQDGEQGEQDTTSYEELYVQLTGPVAESTVLDVRAIDGTAVQAASGLGSADFSLPETVTVNRGEAFARIPVTLNGDDVYEGTETATVVVSARPGDTAVVGRQSATLYVYDDDTPPTFTVDESIRAEGSTDVAVQATVTGAAQAPIRWRATVDGAGHDGSDPAEPDDYDAAGLVATGTLAPGATRLDLGTLSLPLGSADELDETVRVTLAPEGLPAADGYLTIRDAENHLPPAVTVPAAVSVTESGAATVPVTLDFAGVAGNAATSTEKTVTVDYALTPGSATAGSDYTDSPAPLSFPTGTTIRNITVPTRRDDIVESSGEDFTVGLTGAANATVGQASVTTVTINDPAVDVARGFTVTPTVAVTEGREGTAEITVSLAAPAAEDLDFAVSATDGTARRAVAVPGGDDFSTPSSVLRILKDQRSAEITVPILEDDVFEEDETATITVEVAPGETGISGTAQVSNMLIHDDDPVPTISLNIASATEGGDIDVIATPSGVAEDPIGYLLKLSGDAGAGLDPAEPSDFSDSGDPVVLPGGGSGPVTLRTIKLTSDAIDEASEKIKAVLENLTAPAEAPVTSTYTITDDPADMPPVVSLSPVTVAESAGGVGVPVTLTYAAGNGATATERPISVTFRADPMTADATDFGAPGPNPVMIPAGAASATVWVPVVNDTRHEQQESFLLQTTGVIPEEAAPQAQSALIGIEDDDPAPAFTVTGDLSVREDAGFARLTVELDSPAPDAVDFTVGARDDSATDSGAGIGGDDYDLTTGVVRIPQGGTAATVTVPIKADDVYEGDEKAQITVALAEGEKDASGGPRDITLSIGDDDAQPVVTLKPVTAVEGAAVDVTVAVAGSTQRAFDLGALSVSGDGGSGDPAEAGDYTTDLNTTLPAGTVSGDVRLGSVRIAADTVDEADEGFTLGIGGATLDFRFSDDPADAMPAVSIGDVRVGESDGTADLTVSLVFSGETTATEQTVSVPWTTVDGSAKSGQDYQRADGTITFGPSETSATVSVPLLGDVRDEDDQLFLVRLGAAAPGGITTAKADGKVTLEDDDEPNAPTLPDPADLTGGGKVFISGTAAAGEKVELLGAPGSSGGTFRVLLSTETNSDGAYSFSPTFKQGYRVQVRSGKLTSPIRIIQVKQDPDIKVSSPSRRTARITVTGDPAREGQAVTVQQQDGGGWETVATGRLDEDGTFVTTEGSLRSGRNYVYRATVAAVPAAGILAGRTASKTIKVK
ncbi:Calx-beta domain-containing protein [Actinoplanes sichuanensis]|uniref:Calx-beta domain-containing protein n=2 Tax=Actinoplanes sichuanensis TaxID=512349 RepID=A0ABW4AJ62_9ACTN|nr:Calx-beta domain-containing protein [Actinoplanes sichuanensis]